MKPIRFKRLLAARDDEEMLRGMRRLVRLAGQRIDVGDLAFSIIHWGDRTRTRWALDYYAAPGAEPQAEPDDPTADRAEPDTAPPEANVSESEIGHPGAA